VDEQTSARGAQLLLERGFDEVYALLGGWQAWLDRGYPTVPVES
jgi:rhodanese-related sulfurtransferase